MKVYGSMMITFIWSSMLKRNILWHSIPPNKHPSGVIQLFVVEQTSRQFPNHKDDFEIILDDDGGAMIWFKITV